jgi:hypothetical protein
VTGRSSIGQLLVLLVASACGGSTRAPEHDASSGGTIGSSDGGARAGASLGARASSGGSSVLQPNGGAGLTGSAGAGDSGGGGGGGGGGGTEAAPAGAGGKWPDETGGGAGALSCASPYTPPSGGPRSEGPALFHDCADAPDEDIIERFESFDARVPQDLYFEAGDAIVFWKDPCASSLTETVMRGPTDGLGSLEGQAENDWFYEASYCYMGLRRRERNLRCDYFDGKKLADLNPANYGLFASLLWWREHANQSGAGILSSSVAIGSATDSVELCTFEGTRGDFGLCDSIRVMRTRHVITANHEVRLGTPEVVRTVNGKCH